MRFHSVHEQRNEPHNRQVMPVAERSRLLPAIRLHFRTKVNFILLVSVTLCLILDRGLAQTTRTSPSAAAATRSIPLGSATGPNSPCSNAGPSSPCYSANAPHNPCYSAISPNDPCSTTTTTTPQALPPASLPVATTPRATEHAFTADQARLQIEAQGYSNVSGLRKDAKGVWRGTATKDGVPVSVRIDSEGKIAPN
jgi:hypothetical protein